MYKYFLKILVLLMSIPIIGLLSILILCLLGFYDKIMLVLIPFFYGWLISIIMLLGLIFCFILSSHDPRRLHK